MSKPCLFPIFKNLICPSGHFILLQQNTDNYHEIGMDDILLVRWNLSLSQKDIKSNSSFAPTEFLAYSQSETPCLNSACHRQCSTLIYNVLVQRIWSKNYARDWEINCDDLTTLISLCSFKSVVTVGYLHRCWMQMIIGTFLVER